MNKHQDTINGTISTFDRLIFKGHLTAFFPKRAFGRFLSTGVQGNYKTHKLEVVHKPRKCLHFYFYSQDREFGFMHVRLQSWFPFAIQIYINGREWLAGQLEQRRIRYQRYDNKITQVSDLAAAKALCKKLLHRKWPRVLNAFARRVNPHLETIHRTGFGGYYWVTDQGEYATDALFDERTSLNSLFPALVELSMTALVM